jgi:hypothetical protein
VGERQEKKADAQAWTCVIPIPGIPLTLQALAPCMGRILRGGITFLAPAKEIGTYFQGKEGPLKNARGSGDSPLNCMALGYHFTTVNPSLLSGKME